MSLITEDETRKLSRFFRVLAAARAGGIASEIGRRAGVGTSSKELRTALEKGFVTKLEGWTYHLTSSGSAALLKAVEKLRAEGAPDSYHKNAMIWRKRIATGLLQDADSPRELFGLLKYWRVLYALKDGPVMKLKAIAERGHCGACGREMRQAQHAGHVSKSAGGYVLTDAGQAELQDKIKLWWPSDSAWSEELARRKQVVSMGHELRASLAKHGPSEAVTRAPEAGALLKLSARDLH